MTAAILRRLDMCSCVVTVAAAAQDTAEGAVVVAAGGAAGDPSDGGCKCSQDFHWGAAQ
jgi:hypothetical protein